MSETRFLFDENMPHTIRDQLLRREPTITVLSIGVAPAPMLGTLDPNSLVWLEEEQYLLDTRNRRSMPVHLRDHPAMGRHIPGIITMRPEASLGYVIDDLILIWHLAEPDEYQDQRLYLVWRPQCSPVHCIYAAAAQINMFTRVQNVNFWRSSV